MFLIPSTKQSGFTLIELITSIVVIGIISSVVVSALNTSRNKTNDAKIKSSLNNMRGYSELIFTQNGSYDSFCTSESVLNAIGASSINATTTCVDGDRGWAIESELSSDLYFCADFSGYSTTTNATGISLTDFGCAANTGTSTDSYTVVEAPSSPPGTSCEGVCNIFVTHYISSGHLGGKEGADISCNNDTFKPDGGTYKALLGFSGPDSSGRYADLDYGASSDWVFYANTDYYRSDNNILIGTTNSNGWFDFPLTNSITELEWTGIWTGLESDGTPSSYNCLNWEEENNPDVYGYLGDSGYTDFRSSFQEMLQDCTYMNSLYCVEQ